MKADSIIKSVNAVTEKWAKQRKAEERGRARTRRDVLTRYRRTTIKDAAWQAGHQKEWQRIQRGETLVARGVCEHLWQHLQRVEIDDIHFGEDSHPAHVIGVAQIRQGGFRFKVDGHGRIHTNLTNLPRTLRRHLSADGERLVNVDIGESQPVFVGLALASAASRPAEGKKGNQGKQGPKKEGGRGGEDRQATGPLPPGTLYTLDKPTPTNWSFDRGRLPGDLREYLGPCEQRGLYQAVADPLGLTRDQAKHEIMVVLYGKSSLRTPARKVLDERFPTVMRAIRRIKRHDHRRLAQFAQGAESAFVYGQIVPRIMAARPDLLIETIHDSVLTTVGEEEYVRQVMLDEFDLLGLSPTVKVERC